MDVNIMILPLLLASGMDFGQGFDIASAPLGSMESFDRIPRVMKPKLVDGKLVITVEAVVEQGGNYMAPQFTISLNEETGMYGNVPFHLAVRYNSGAERSNKIILNYMQNGTWNVEKVRSQPVISKGEKVKIDVTVTATEFSVVINGQSIGGLPRSLPLDKVEYVMVQRMGYLKNVNIEYRAL